VFIAIVVLMRTGLIDLISRYRRRFGRAWRAWRIEYVAEPFVQSDGLVARHSQSGGERDAYNVVDTNTVNRLVREGHRDVVGVNNFELLRGGGA
jgi:hypothetical protein